VNYIMKVNLFEYGLPEELIAQQPAPQASAVQVAQEAADRQRYQTVYAAQPGAVAAPTALTASVTRRCMPPSRGQ